jgi:signal transduction histidine kinase
MTGPATFPLVSAGLHFAPGLLLAIIANDIADFLRKRGSKDKGTGLGLAIAKRTIEAHGGRIAASLRGETGLTFDMADREKMRQVLVNLIENAGDAMAGMAGCRRLRVVASGRNGTATVRVTDTGPGVAADVLPRLFEPFFSQKPSGTGLGLANARRTVEAHGGRIEAASSPGGGMTFAIELPLARGEVT